MNTETDTRPRSKNNGRRGYLILGGIVLVFAVGWSIFWFVAAGRVEAELEKTLANLARQGTRIECAEKAVKGYPFRLEVLCNSMEAETPGQDLVRSQAVRAVALVYNPTHLIIEADGPATAQSALYGFNANADWQLAQASTQIGLAGIEETSIAVDDANVDLDGLPQSQKIQVGRFEAHARKRASSDGAGVDLAVSARKLSLSGGVNTEYDADFDLIVWIPEGEQILAGKGDQVLLKYLRDGGEIGLTQARIASLGAEIMVSGSLIADREGRLSGDLVLRIVEPTKFGALIEAYLPNQAGMTPTLQAAVGTLGKKVERENIIGYELPLKLKRGKLQVGFIPLGKIPPLPPFRQ
ncbi:MAG: DUF2125 domain-containing protein [Stappiaceae bacterium]